MQVVEVGNKFKNSATNGVAEFLKLNFNFMFLTPIITLPDNFVSSIVGYVGQLFTDLGGYIALVLGVLLGTLVIAIIINTLHK